MFILEKFIDIIAPHECLVCSAEGSLLCGWCKPDAFSPTPPRCYRCSAQTSDSSTCQKCRRQSPLNQVWVVTEYANLAQELVRQLKFSHKRIGAEVMAECLDGILPYLDSDTLIVHIPTAPKRVRQRGFDHAQLIAQALARRRNLKHDRLLIRTGKSRQVGAKREMRRQQLEGAFWVRGQRNLKGKTIILVDDVLTTGATLEAAARTLKTHGAKTVLGAVFAQKLI